MTLNNYLTNIADAVRTKKGSSKKLPLTSIAEEIESIGANNANIAELPNMGGSYTNAYIMDYIRDIDAGGWDVTNLKSFPVFGDANSKLETIKFKGIKGTEKVTSLDGIFSSLSKLTSIDFSDFDTSACTNMLQMLYRCSSLTSLDLSKFDTSSCTNMGSMFYYCSSLTSLDLSNFDTSSCTSMSNMFSSCSKLSSLDLSKFDTSACTDMGGMFNSCSKLPSITFGDKWDTSSCTNMSGMFYNCSSLTSLDLSNFDTSACTSMRYAFDNCSSLTSLTLGADWGINASITSFGLAYCPLTHDSCLDVFNKLADKTQTATTSATLNLNSTTRALMSADEIKIATDKGWTVS